MSLFTAGLQPALDSNGRPISGAVWRFYRTGTTTPLRVFADSALTVSLGSSITADAAGRFAPAYFDDVYLYRAVLEDAEGAPISPYDIDPANTPLGSEAIYGEFDPATEGQTVFTFTTDPGPRVVIYAAGILQILASYTLVDRTLTFTYPLAADVVVSYLIGQDVGLLRSMIFGPGNATPVAGSKMRIDGQMGVTAFAPENYGGLWSSGTMSFRVIANEVDTDTLTDDDHSPIGGGPLFNFLSIIDQNGAEGDAVAIGGIAWGRASDTSVFGANLIVGSEAGTTDVKATGLEIDVLTYAAPAAGSIGLAMNIFNHASSMPVAQISGVAGGTWGNGFITGAITGTHYGRDANDTTAANYFLYAASPVGYSYNVAAIFLGKGASEGIGFGGLFGASPFLYSDASDNFITNLGSTDIWNIQAHGGVVTFAFNALNKTTFQATTTVSALPAAGTAGRRAYVTDANATTFNSTVAGGGSNKVPVHDNGTNWVIG